jgi:ABC-type multidrug transport system fused ATPase/permease subunit
MDQMFELRARESLIRDSPQAEELVIDTPGTDIEFDNVYFSYPVSSHRGLNSEKQRQILNGVSFKVQAGSTVAIVGSSGSGKSTIFRLLYRFYEPSGGKISIHNRDISRLTLGSLRKKIGYLIII